MKNNIYIMVVDNDPKTIRSAWRALNPEGYSVEGILSGKEAIRKITHNNYDLIFVTLTAMEIDGITLIKRIKQLRPNTGIMVITDDPSQEPVREAHRLGIISHIRKPFTPEILKDVTNKAIEWMRENALENKPEEEFSQSKFAKLDNVIQQYKNDSRHILQVLLRAQDIFGHLPSLIQKHIAKGMNMYISEIHSIVSFYPCFRTKPGGDHTPCYMRGPIRIWSDVTWKTGKRIEKAVNEFIKLRELAEAKGV